MVMNVADLVDPTDVQGRTYRQINATLTHDIPIGTLVELRDGCRLWVVNHGRDCDQTPMYYVSKDREDIVRERPGFKNRSWIGGYGRESVTPVEAGKATLEE